MKGTEHRLGEFIVQTFPYACHGCGKHAKVLQFVGSPEEEQPVPSGWFYYDGDWWCGLCRTGTPNAEIEQDMTDTEWELWA